MRTTAQTLLIVVVLSALTAASQSKPDFSGKWTPVAPTSDQPSAAMIVAQDATTLVVTSEGSQGPERLSFKLDGSENKHPLVRPDGTVLERISTAEWSGDQLVISLQSQSNRYGPYTMKQTWSLKDQTLVVEAVLISKTTGAAIVEPGKTTFRRN
jgi:hypothetical protein